MRISDWSSDVCSSDLLRGRCRGDACFRGCRSGQPEYRSRFGPGYADAPDKGGYLRSPGGMALRHGRIDGDLRTTPPFPDRGLRTGAWCGLERTDGRSEEHTSELQSLMRISYAVFCLKKKKTTRTSKQTETKTTKTQH